MLLVYIYIYKFIRKDERVRENTNLTGTIVLFASQSKDERNSQKKKQIPNRCNPYTEIH